jgi:hypothetical protein
MWPFIQMERYSILQHKDREMGRRGDTEIARQEDKG